MLCTDIAGYEDYKITAKAISLLNGSVRELKLCYANYLEYRDYLDNDPNNFINIGYAWRAFTRSVPHKSTAFIHLLLLETLSETYVYEPYELNLPEGYITAATKQDVLRIARALEDHKLNESFYVGAYDEHYGYLNITPLGFSTVTLMVQPRESQTLRTLAAVYYDERFCQYLQSYYATLDSYMLPFASYLKDGEAPVGGGGRIEARNSEDAAPQATVRSDRTVSSGLIIGGIAIAAGTLAEIIPITRRK